MAIESREIIHNAVSGGGLITVAINFDTAVQRPSVQSVTYQNTSNASALYVVTNTQGQTDQVTIAANTPLTTSPVPNNRYRLTADGEGGFLPEFSWSFRGLV